MSKNEIAAMVRDAVSAAVVNAANQAQQAQAPKPQGIQQPVVKQSADGKIVLPTKQAKAREERKDLRIPATIITIGQDQAGNAITLGLSQTMKDDRGRSFDYGFGVEMVDSKGNKTMIWHKADKWNLMAAVAPLVSEAIASRYQYE